MMMPTSFGRYMLTDRIAVGGMAEIFAAKIVGPMGFEKPCVIKRILPQFAEEAEFLRMFVTEAKLVCQLDHPNIAQVFELGEVDDHYYIAMEHVNGVDGRQLWRTLAKQRQRMPPAVALYVVAQVLRGLHYAHTAADESGNPLRVVHRDISPSNVLISSRGHVKISDFGIAYVQHETQSQAGVLKGKYGYMSPEQVAGMPVDHRSDVFAVGIVLTEFLLGRRLFLGESDFETLENVRSINLDVLQRHKNAVPPMVLPIIERALQPDPDNRFFTALAMLQAVETALRQLNERINPSALATFLDHYVLPHIDRIRVPKEPAASASVSTSAPSDPQGILPVGTGSYSAIENAFAKSLGESTIRMHRTFLGIGSESSADNELDAEALRTDFLPAMITPSHPVKIGEVEAVIRERETVDPISTKPPQSPLAAVTTAPPDTPEMSGSLTVQSLTRVLLRLVTTERSGLLTLETTEQHASVALNQQWVALLRRYPSLKQWRPLHKQDITRISLLVASDGMLQMAFNYNETDLMSYLLDEHKVDVETIERAIRLNPYHGVLNALQTARQLTPIQLSQHVTQYALSRLTKAFGWTIGTYTFYRDVDELAEGIPLGMRTPQLIMLGASQLLPEHVADQLHPLSDAMITAHVDTNMMETASATSPIVSVIYEQLQPMQTVGETIARYRETVSETDLYRALYLLIESGLFALSPASSEIATEQQLPA